MDIVYINQTFGLGGAEAFNQSLINYLTQKHNVYVYSNSDYFSGYKVPFAVDFIGDWKGFIKGIISFVPLTLFYLYIILKHGNATHYYFTGFIEKIICTPILKILGKKVIWIEFGPLESVVNKFLGFPKLLYCSVSGLPDKCIFSSLNSRNLNQKYFPPHTPLFVIPLGSPLPLSSNKVTPFDALCISRLEPGKGQDLLIQEWHQVNKIFPRASLYIAGTGDIAYTNKLKRLIADNQNIKLLGFVTNKYDYLNACKFTIFPSQWPLEGFGLVITESLSVGKPVVAFDRAPGNEIIRSGYNGLLGKTLYENITYILKNPKVLQKLSLNARKDYLNHYSHEIYLKAYAKMIESSHA